MEDFVQGMFEDFKDLFGSLPKIASTPEVPGSSLRKNTDGEFVLHSEYRSSNIAQSKGTYVRRTEGAWV